MLFEIHEFWWKFSRSSAFFKMIFYGEDQNMLDSQISWDFATKKLSNFSENYLREVRFFGGCFSFPHLVFGARVCRFSAFAFHGWAALVFLLEFLQAFIRKIKKRKFKYKKRRKKILRDMCQQTQPPAEKIDTTHRIENIKARRSLQFEAIASTLRALPGWKSK